MGKTKETFLQLRELESLGYDHTFSKKDAKKAGQNLVENITNSGDLDVVDVAGNLIRLKEVVATAETELKKSDAFVEALEREREGTQSVTRNGITFAVSNSGDRLDYEKDPVYKELKDKLKHREGLLKQAYKSKQKGGETIYAESVDQETGEVVAQEVPAVPVKTVGKQTIRITY